MACVSRILRRVPPQADSWEGVEGVWQAGRSNGTSFLYAGTQSHIEHSVPFFPESRVPTPVLSEKQLLHDVLPSVGRRFAS